MFVVLSFKSGNDQPGACIQHAKQEKYQKIKLKKYFRDIHNFEINKSKEIQYITLNQ